VRALPAYARSYRLIQAWTDEGAARCSLAQQVFGVICVVASGSAATKPCFIDYRRTNTFSRTWVRDFLGLARELDRDVKQVHEDVSMLIKHGLVVRTADRKICVPYDVIHADFDLRAVA
jgi:hypothetical protein